MTSWVRPGLVTSDDVGTDHPITSSRAARDSSGDGGDDSGLVPVRLWRNAAVHAHDRGPGSVRALRRRRAPGRTTGIGIRSVSAGARGLLCRSRPGDTPDLAPPAHRSHLTAAMAPRMAHTGSPLHCVRGGRRNRRPPSPSPSSGRSWRWRPPSQDGSGTASNGMRTPHWSSCSRSSRSRSASR